ncbi:defective chorion-1 protein, FC125 isoform isoform X12 [Drosophila guanche]|uniref:defective chorion-1 protein, FC125 isoform isoform X12 n=1 Tax=Drosophila guanche TaxID=7266 RepID=UPI0014716CD6|nr:defective chorion-1 protein, FC125 isoform isoform X12 [Drosophila guanche]
MRLQCLLLLAPCLALVVLGQETAPQATVTTGDAGEQENPNNGTADTKPRMPTEETILGQMPPITPLRSGVPSLDAFYMLFPALGSLLRWGALFPAPTILGAVPDSLQPTAAASKVVLVLADDPTAKTRVPRQDAPPPTNPFGQFLAQMPNANFAQGLMNPANFNPDNFNLGQMAPNVGQALTNMQLPPMPTMPQFGFENILGAAPPPPPAALPPAPAEPAPPADKPADEPNAPVAAPNPFAFLNPSNFDMNQMLGQAQQSLPQMPSGVDFFSNLRQMWPGAPPASPAPGSEGQASDISEIRVRPEEAAYSQENNLDEKERVPLLWFRMPMNRQGDEGESKPLEDLRVEAKLRAFERQVIAELKMLQQIERVAREMRSSAASSRGSSTSGSPFKISYPLSRTPVHKITRADIEQALRDDYVRRLLHKEAQRKSRANHAAFKRQTMPADASMSKEDIVKIMAYAYRMATEQQTAEKNKEDKIYAAYRATGDKPQQQERQMQQQPMMMQQQPMPQMQQRQWEAEKQEAKMQQNPMMMMQQEQQRQWEAEQNEAKMQQQRQMMAEQRPMMIQQQQRQWEAEQKEAKIQQIPMMMQQRQWEAVQKEAKIQQNPMMMQQQQRQWEAEQNDAKMQQQQRQWEAEKQEAKIQQNPMMMQQQRQMTMDPMQMQQLDSARQWGEPQGDAGEEGEAMLGEAEPQMPEVPGQARHKGVDMLGLGGNKRKKSKHGQGSPTVINYYAVQQQQQRPQPSYGTSYGGGGYGSNAYGGGGYSSGGYSSGGYSSGGHSSGGYSSGGHSSGGYSSGGYRAALGNEEVDEMLRQHQTMARTINPGNPNGVQQQEQEERSINQTTPQLTPTQRLHKSQSSASTASESESETESESDPVLGSKYSFKEGILQPYMGLLPISHPDDPWTHKAYDPHHALYTGGGSYAAYLKDNDGRRRRDTHIMPQLAHQRSLLTPDMLERLLRIKIEFQRRFPHLYKTMLSHHTNQTRVEVQPPVLGRKTAVLKEAKPKYASDEGPVYELGAAERGLFEEEEEDQAEAAADPEPNLDIKESQESSNNNNDDEGMDTSGRKEQDDNELDYFNFDDDDDDTDNIDD